MKSKEEERGAEGSRKIRDLQSSLKKRNRTAENDPARPLCHFIPPAGWINDPNGTIWHGGYYHLFYQHNPHDDVWGTIHWGHGRSRNLVDWEYLPTALIPDGATGETSCFSGCCAVTPAGIPAILYTSVARDPGETPWDQRLLFSDDDLIEWRKGAGHPVLDLRTHGGPEIEGDWRDPYLFSAEGKHFLLLGARLTKEKGGDSVVLLYESADDHFLHWEYKSILIRRPRYEIEFFECPNLIQFRNRWLLLTSTYRTVEYYAGDFDAERGSFSPVSHGELDGGVELYATNTALSPDGRTILFAWMRGFNERNGWCGQMVFPRELSLDEKGTPRQKPAAEIAELRKNHVSLERQTITEERIYPPEGVSDSPLEVQGHFTLGNSAILEIGLSREPEEKPAFTIRFDGRFLDVGGTRTYYAAGDPVLTFDIHIIVDRGIIEVFLDGGRKVVSRGLWGEGPGRCVSLRTLNGTAALESMELWTLREGQRKFAPDSV